MPRLIGLLFLLLATPAIAQLPGGRVVDLTHPFGRDTIYWPTAEPFTLTVVNDGVTPGGYYYAANNFSAAEHGGTHIDAPVHFARGHRTVDSIPVEQLIGPAIVVDISGPCAHNRDYQVTVADLQAWEKAHHIIKGEIVLLRTGWATRWPDKKQYLGTEARGPAALAQLHFPGLRPDAAHWLAERHVKAVGIDTASIDYGQSTRYQSHQTLFAADIPAFENIGDLSVLPTEGATLIALPMKIEGGSGAPLRVIAILPATP
jgi:kynurenine formamidase